MRDPRALFQPNLRGLARSEVNPSTWRLARLSVALVWIWLALGLVFVALKDLELLSPDGILTLAAAWLAMVTVNGLAAAATQLALLCDGWATRPRGWRARGVVGVTALLAMLIALAAYLWRFAGWLWE
jgi:hypothetical protein